MEEMEEWEKDIRVHYLWKRYEGADELIIMIKELIAKKIANLKKSMAKNTREQIKIKVGNYQKKQNNEKTKQKRPQ